MKENLITGFAMASLCFMAVNNAVAATAESASVPELEKCYGIAKAGMNDCQTSMSSCASSSTKDKQSDAFLFLPKGLCDRIADGKLGSTENKK